MKKLLSVLIAVIMIFGMMPSEILADSSESESHVHMESCYGEEGDLLCGFEGSTGHVHSEECICSGGELICGEEDNAEHQHNELCYCKGGEYICGFEAVTALYTLSPGEESLKKIVNFEDSNPVFTAKYNTGDSVSESQFPDTLPAVVEISVEGEIEFTQVKPLASAPYKAPDDAEKLYTDGERVVYSYTRKDGSTVYRLYGEVTGVGEGWFDCDETGTAIKGLIQKVPVTWDISSIDTSAAGLYVVSASVEGYNVLCSAPKAEITVVSKSGDQTIANHSIKWLSGTNTTVIDNNELSITPESNRFNASNVTCQINFSMGGEETIPAGKINIRLPLYIFYDRKGEPVGSVNIPLAKAPQTGGNTGFNYYIDDENNEIVISNYIDISSSYVFMCQVQYGFTPFAVKDGFSNDQIKAKFRVEMSDGGALYAESDELSVKVDTDVYMTGNKKTFESKYEIWNDSWGTKPDDADKYVYIVWRFYTKVLPKTTQPYDLIIEEQGGRGEVVGWSYNRDLSNLNLCTTEEFNAIKVVSRDDTYRYSSDSIQTRFVLMRYLRDDLAVDPVIKNNADISVVGMDGSTQSQPVEASYTYVPVNMDYPGDDFGITKSLGPAAVWDIKGALNQLEDGKTVGSTKTCFSLSVSNRRWELSNKGADDYTTVVEDDFMYYDKKLNEEDYSLTGFYVKSFLESEPVIDPEVGYKSVSAPIESYHPIKVLIKESEDGEWQKIGEYSKLSSGGKWTAVSGEEVQVANNGIISLPENTYAVRFEHTGNQYEVDFEIALYYELYPTQKVIEAGKGKGASVLYNYCSAYTVDKDGNIHGEGPRTFINSNIKKVFDERDKALYGIPVAHVGTSQRFSRFVTKSSMYKSVDKSLTSDPATSSDYLGYKIMAYEVMDFSGSGLTKNEVIDSGIIKEQREGIFYDLLPAGTILLDVNAVTYGFSITNQKNCEYTIETIENWRGSGRTMLVIHVYAPESFANFDVFNNQLVTGFVLRIDIVNPWTNIKDNGSKVTNSAAYYSLSGSLGTGYADNGGNIKDKQWFIDLDNDGNTDDSVKNVMYAEVSTTFSPLVANELGFKKTVKSLEDAVFNTDARVRADRTYTYQLRFANGEHIYASNVIMFDVLESAYQSNPYWQGTLKSIDISQALKLGIDAKVYYSTSDEFANLTTHTEYTDLTNGSLWSDSAPHNLADVTAVAVDLRYKTDGSEYVFNPEQSVVCFINMTALSDYELYMDRKDTEADETVYAYNSAYVQKTTTPVAGGSVSTSINECSRVEVALSGPMVEIKKESDPVSGTASQPKLVEVNDTVKYNITVSNTNKAEAVRKVVIEDAVPVGLNVNEADIQCYFGNKVSSAVPISESPRVTLVRNGQKLVFTVDKLSAGETVHLIIPSVVDISAASGKTFVNTAAVVKFNDVDWNIESESTYHKTQALFTGVTVKKQWNDGDNRYGKRPESVVVQLYADSNPVAGKTAVLNAENDWQFTFSDLDKFRSDGITEIKYTVLETSAVPGYTTTYSEDNLTVINTANTSVKNGSVTFKVKKYRTGTTIPVQGAVFVLKDGDTVVASSTTNEKGEAVFTVTPEGDTAYELTLSEQSAPAGYTASEDVWTVCLKRNDPADISIDTGKNLIQVIWNWVAELFGKEPGSEYKDGILTVYNDYTANTSLTIKANKTLTGMDMAGGEFTFLVEEEGHTVASGTNDAEGTISFTPIQYTMADVGTHNYIVREEAGTNPGITYDTAAYPLKVVVKDRGDGTLSTDVTYSSPDNTNNLIFANSYTAKGTGIKLAATKILSGNKVLEDNMFEFVVTEDGHEITRGKNSKDGTVSFDEIKYTQKGEHTYTISEVKGSMGGIDYDTNVFTVTVSVEDNGKGQLVASPVYPAGGIVFRNRYSVGGGGTDPTASVVLHASKKLTGKTLSANMFNFVVTENDAVVTTGTNDETGDIKFSAISYTAEGEHKYVIKETGGSLGGISYDERTYQVTVYVEDVGDGTLHTRVEYPEGGVNFENVYSASPVSVTLNGLKKLSGKSLKEGEFSFRLTDGAGNTVETVFNKADGEFEFSPLEFNSYGQYIYTVSENNDGKPKITYDSTVYQIIINVTDDGVGMLKAEVLYPEGGILFQNKYTKGDNPHATSASVTLTAAKTLDGTEPNGSDFSFILKDESGKVVQSKNNVGGKITFDRLTFNKPGKFVYYIVEQAGSDGRIVYDSTVYKAVITVQNDGNYYASVKYERDGEPYRGTPIFRNTTEDIPPIAENTFVTVNKVWDDNMYAGRPEKITVQLLCNGDAYGEAVTLSEENGWQYTWDELPSDAQWAVDETYVPDNYSKTVAQSGNVWTITNHYEAAQISDSVQVPESHPTENVEKVPPTGDTNSIVLWSMAAAGCIAGLMCMLFVSKKKKS